MNPRRLRPASAPAHQRPSLRARLWSAVVPMPFLAGAAVASILVAPMHGGATLLQEAPRHEAAAPVAAEADEPELTIEAVLSVPFPYAAVAAPAGTRFAWVEDHRGVQNIWVHEGGAGDPRQVTGYSVDRGQNLSEVRWTPDGSGLVFVRGQGSNAWGEHENPTSDPAGAERAVWHVDARGEPPRRVGRGHDPRPSPSGDRVLFRREDGVWVADLSGDREPRRLFHARGAVTEARWSPDGEAVAFVSRRPDHSYVGVYYEARDTIRYLDPGVDSDRTPRWAPDSRRLAFVRNVAAEGHAVVVADVETGEAEEVWRGSSRAFPSMASGFPLFWTADDHLVFPSEEDDWQHLWAVEAVDPTAGAGPKEALQLTEGECEVEDAVLSPDRSHLVASTNCDDRERRQLYRVDPAAGAAEQITGGAIDWGMAVAADGTVLFHRGDGRMPPLAHRVDVMGGEPEPLREEAVPPEFPLDALVDPDTVTLQAEDGWEIPAQLFRCEPGTGACPEAGERPGLLFLHGGPRRQMFPGWHNMGYYWKTYAFNQYLAAQGYVVLSVNFRSGVGYGRDFRLAPERGAQGASEYADVLAGAEFLQELPDVDPDRIGLWGGSYGGYLTQLGMGRSPDVFAAGVNIHGVHDWNLRRELPPWATERRDVEEDESWEVRHEASPVAYVEDLEGPVLLVTGDDDRNVRFLQTIDLVERMRRNDKEYELLVLPDEVHSFLLRDSWVEIFRASADFLQRELWDAGVADGGTEGGGP